ncbi:MAG: hypothetical protein COA57_14725 [Flavobacteriales bacterium]|nr:MAG: hypothetical protein COA57_14725 [Flavobacteriales bacterium]
MGDLTRGVTYEAAGEVTNINLHALVDDAVVKSGVITTAMQHASDFTIVAAKLASHASTDASRAVSSDHIKTNSVIPEKLEVTGGTELTAGQVDAAADKLLIYDDSASEMKIVKPDNLGLTANGLLLSGATTKAALVDADRIPFQDTEASDVTKVITRGNFNALVLKLDLTGTAAKTTLVAADHILMADSAASDVIKKVTVANLVPKSIYCLGHNDPSPAAWNTADFHYSWATPTSPSNDTFDYNNTTENSAFNDQIVNGNVIVFFRDVWNVAATLPTSGSNPPVSNTPYILKDVSVGSPMTTFKLDEIDGTDITFTSAAPAGCFIGCQMTTLAKSGDIHLIRISELGEFMLVFGTAYSAINDYGVEINAHSTLKDPSFTAYADFPNPAENPISSDNNAVITQAHIWSKTINSVSFRVSTLAGNGLPIDAKYLSVKITDTTAL